MKGSIFSVRARLQLRKTMHNVRVTLLCGLLTFIVLRSSLGAGKFGTPAQDYDEIRHHLKSFKLMHQNRLLMKDASRSTLSLSEELNQRNLQELSYAGGHVDNAKALVNWDMQRASWLAENPTLASAHGHDRIMLVTGSHSTTNCPNAMGAQLRLKSLKNKMDYCRLHGIDIFYDNDETIKGGPSKAPLVKNLMLSHPEVEWIWWMDSDSMLTDMSPRVPVENYEGSNVVYHSRNNADNMDTMAGPGLGRKSWPGGSFLLRNCQSSFELLRDWAMADMPGMWTDRRRSNAELYQPAGEGNWPFVAHFSRCNVCSRKEADHVCMSDMERAFMLADGQQRQLPVLERSQSMA